MLAEAICTEIQPPDPTAPWRAQLELLMGEYRRVLLAHRDAAHVLAATLPSGAHRLRLVDLSLGAVRAAGFEAWEATRAGRLLVDYTTGFVQEEYVTAARPSLDVEEPSLRERLPAISDVSEQAYPNIAALRSYLVDRGGDARYEFGLGVILDGLQQRQVP